MAKNLIFEKLPKIDFLTTKFLNRGKNLLAKLLKICQTRLYTYIEGIFSHFLKFISYFLKFWPKNPKNHFLAKIPFFGGQNDRIFKNEKLNKNNGKKKTFRRRMYLDGLWKFLAILVKKYFFDPCSKIFGSKNLFLKKQF